MIPYSDISTCIDLMQGENKDELSDKEESYIVTNENCHT
jgi:hypothetical protein